MAYQVQEGCVLLFSGGRDSTIAAIRLATRYKLVLVTVTSEHLVGIDAVESRIDELSRVMSGFEWHHVLQPDVGADHDSRTCLPCHLAYVAVGVAELRERGWRHIAFGYTKYQSDWPEQTPIAIDALESALKGGDYSLLLPAYEVASKEEAIQELRRHGLNTEALEQKCLLQKLHHQMAGEALRERVAAWQHQLAHVVEAPPKLKRLNQQAF